MNEQPKSRFSEDLKAYRAHVRRHRLGYVVCALVMVAWMASSPGHIPTAIMLALTWEVMTIFGLRLTRRAEESMAHLAPKTTSDKSAPAEPETSEGSGDKA